MSYNQLLFLVSNFEWVLMAVEYLMFQEYVEIDVFLVLEVCLVELVL